MDPLTGGLLSGGISAIASIFNTQQNNSNQQALLTQQENYNTQMSNTAYQRAAADMKAAGLNPMMMAAGGMSASTPTAPAAQPQQSALSGIGAAIDKTVSTAIAMKTVDKMSEEIANMKAEELKRQAETKTEEARPGLVKAEEQKALIDASRSASETEIRKASLPIAIDEALSAKNRSDMNPTVRRLLDQAGFAGHEASRTLSPISNIVSSARQWQALRHFW